jgi:separase
VTLLFGCSSGRLKGSGEYEPEGNVLNYLLAGCPAVVANLWDVTDKDLDLFSKELMDSWIDGRSTVSPSFDKTSLPGCVAVARKKCKWPFIVGAAPVCYGVPVINRSVAAVSLPLTEPKKVVKRKK